MERKILSLLLALLMCLSLALPAMASGEPETDTDAAPAAEAEETAAEAEETAAEMPGEDGAEPAPAADGASEGTLGDNLTWTLSDDGVLTIPGGVTDYGITWSLADGVLTLEGEGWLSPDTAWSGYADNVKSIVIGEGITDIGQEEAPETGSQGEQS